METKPSKDGPYLQVSDGYHVIFCATHNGGLMNVFTGKDCPVGIYYALPMLPAVQEAINPTAVSNTSSPAGSMGMQGSTDAAGQIIQQMMVSMGMSK